MSSGPELCRRAILVETKLSCQCFFICCLADSVLPEALEYVTPLESIECLRGLADFEVVLESDCPLLELGAVWVRGDSFL